MKKIIPIIAVISAVSSAHAAKLCKIWDKINTMTFNIPSAQWAAGENCVGWSFDDGRTESTDVTTFCSSRYVSGIARCAESADGSKDPTSETEPAGSAYCYCKMTYPVIGKWTFIGYSNGCSHYCPATCGQNAWNKSIAGQNLIYSI
jgi:hypothetical protein